MFDVSVINQDGRVAETVANKPDLDQAARFALDLADALGRQTSGTDAATGSVRITCLGDVVVSISIIEGGLAFT